MHVSLLYASVLSLTCSKLLLGVFVHMDRQFPPCIYSFDSDPAIILLSQQENDSMGSETLKRQVHLHLVQI